MPETVDKHCQVCGGVYSGGWDGPYMGQIQDLISLGFYLDSSKKVPSTGICNSESCRRKYEEEFRLQIFKWELEKEERELFED